MSVSVGSPQQQSWSQTISMATKKLQVLADIYIFTTGGRYKKKGGGGPKSGAKSKMLLERKKTQGQKALYWMEKSAM